MPWKQIDPMDERIRFVIAADHGLLSMTELCERHGISRKTGYKWYRRYQAEGQGCLLPRSHVPRTCPHRTPAAVEARIVAVRRARPTWGPRKILHYLTRTEPEFPLPAESTAGDILVRHSLVRPRKRRRRVPHPTAASLNVSAPNQVWSADFKGQFRLLDSIYCYPLTVSDAHSRYLLACDGLRSIRHKGVRPVFARIFSDYGLPDAIRTDNGHPFASQGVLGLTLLSAWWIKLGIRHQRIAPGQPQQNGRHERMHRTLKQETALPPKADMNAQQVCFDAFINDYNSVRPHQSLDGDVPASHYKPSVRQMPRRIPKPDYPQHAQVRKVSSKGTIKLHSKNFFISLALSGEYLALEEVDYGIWTVNFYNTLITRFDEHNYKLT